MTDFETSDSTLIRRGTEASTFQDMIAYAETLEQRPVLRLLEELPALAGLSRSKFDLTVHILRGRFRRESEVDRQQLTILASEIADSVPQSDVAQRIRRIFVDEARTTTNEARA